MTIGLLSHTKCCATEKMENDQLNAPCNKIRVQIRALDFTTQDHKYRNSRSILPNSLSPSRPITTVFPLLFVCQLALVVVCMTPSTSDWSQMTSTKTDHAANNQPSSQPYTTNAFFCGLAPYRGQPTFIFKLPAGAGCSLRGSPLVCQTPLGLDKPSNQSPKSHFDDTNGHRLIASSALSFRAHLVKLANPTNYKGVPVRFLSSESSSVSVFRSQIEWN